MIEKLFLPIKRNIVFFCIYSVLFIIPNIYDYYIIRTSIAKHIFISSFPIFLIFIYSYTICLIGELIGSYSNTLKRIYHISIHSILYFTAITDVFCLVFIKYQFNDFCLNLITETNTTEAFDFIRTYFLNYKFLLIILLFLFLFLIEFFFCKILKKNNLINVVFTIILYYIISLITILSIAFIGTNICQKSNIKYSEYLKNNFFYRTYKAFYLHNQKGKNILECANITKSIEIDSCSYKSSNIVLIIGESYNKHHSSLYNYYLETSPKLSSLKDKGLYVFNDVISPCNTTTNSFQCFMSFMSTDKPFKWYETPLFPVFFRRAGYHVSLISNQYLRSILDIDAVNKGNFMDDYFLKHPIIDSVSFDYRNDVKMTYDHDFINKYLNNKSQFTKDSLNLTIYHLMGQHFFYKSRYPEQYQYFTKDSILRNDLKDSYKEIIADYDNATRYNDEVVYNIINSYKDDDAIIIYFADHAEEVYDFRLVFGRTFDKVDVNAGKEYLHNQFDVPFLIFVTNNYKKNHPTIIKKIERAINNPFIIDDLPHLMLDLAGIKTKWYEAERSLINEKFNLKRKRLIFNPTEPDKLFDYDEICK